MLKSLSFAMLFSAVCAAAPLERWDGQPAVSRGNGFPLRNALWITSVPGSPDLEEITLRSASPWCLGLSPRVASIRLEWLTPGPVAHYRRSLDLNSGIATTSFVRNGARITQSTFLATGEPLFVMHLRADKPGALDFKVTLALPDQSPVTLDHRRELSGGRLRVWVLPFESDVEPANGGIMVRGEGEAIILVSTGTPDQLDRYVGGLGRKFDGRETFPDLTKIWAGLLARQQSPPH